MDGHPTLYETLGVPPDASDECVRQAYKRLARQNHPDRALVNRQCPKKANKVFRRIKYAYEALTDPLMRGVYDREGEQGLRRISEMDEDERPAAAAAATAAFAFSASVAASAGIKTDVDTYQASVSATQGRSAPKKRKGPCVKHEMAVSLEELYLGRTNQIAVNRWVVCPKNSCPMVCGPCGGQGRIFREQLIGFGRTQRFASKCPACCGGGCKYQLTQKKDLLPVAIEPGMRTGDKIVQENAGDQQNPCIEPGDIVITINEKPHPRFQRVGDDLIIPVKITLGEALCGFEIPIRHLDGRKLVVRPAQGEIIRPGAVKAVGNEGMPVRRRSDKGQLILKFDVLFPPDAYICEQVRQKLRAVMPGCPQITGKREEAAKVCGKDDSYVEEVVCRTFEEECIGRANTKRCFDLSDNEEELEGDDLAAYNAEREKVCDQMMNSVNSCQQQ